MPKLAYCITDANATLEIPHAGIAGALVETVEHAGLRCLVSPLEPDSRLSGREVALTFHRVLQDVFRQAAIIPFRFPTTVQDDAELLRFLDGHADDYRDCLLRLRDMVQMEVLITWRIRDGVISPPQTGTGYLREKQQRHARLMTLAEAVRSAINTIKVDWRERGSSDGVRLFVLVLRPAVSEFERQLAGLKVDSEFEVRVSGPWPATEFLQKDHARS